MTDNFSPDNFTGPNEQMALWDFLPPEPPDFLDEPPNDEWILPAPPEEWLPPDPPDAELSETIEAPGAATSVNSEAPVLDEPFAPLTALSDESDYVPSNTWERYLVEFTADENPDLLDFEQRSRAQDLELMDARFVGMEYQNEVGSPTGYGVGCIEVYADPFKEGGIGGIYLEIAAFDNPLDAALLYDTLQTPVDKGWIADYSVHDFATFAASEHNVADVWHPSTPDDLAIYNWYAGHDLAFEPPLETDIAHEQSVPSEQPDPAFSALSAIGIQAVDFDPSQDPPPFYDPATGTAYWIGIFQPDLEDPKICVASVLSLGRNPETGSLEAQLAPCVPGDWDKAFESSQHLLNIMERDGIDACFLAAESMAVATDQRDLWATERGIALKESCAEQAAEHAHETWELDL